MSLALNNLRSKVLGRATQCPCTEYTKQHQQPNYVGEGDLEDDTVKYLYPSLPIPTILFPPHPHPASLSVFCNKFCPPPHPIHFFWLCILFFTPSILYAVFFVLRQGYCNKKHLFNRVIIILQLHKRLQSNFSVECHYRKTSLPLPRYYRILFTVPTVLP